MACYMSISHCWGLFLFYLHAKRIFTRAALLTEHIHTIWQIGLIFCFNFFSANCFHFLANAPSALSSPQLLFLLCTKTAASLHDGKCDCKYGRLLPFWRNWCRALRWELHSDCRGFEQAQCDRVTFGSDDVVTVKVAKAQSQWRSLNQNHSL